jgi:hypothetical protein
MVSESRTRVDETYHRLRSDILSGRHATQRPLPIWDTNSNTWLAPSPANTPSQSDRQPATRRSPPPSQSTEQRR